MQLRIFVAVFSVIFLPFVWADAARATIVMYSFSGTVGPITDTSPNHYVPTSVKAGSTFSGWFSFDNAAPQVSTGIYRGTALNMAASVTIDGIYTYTLGPPTIDDEIDITGFGPTYSFGLYARGPTVTEPFAPNPPFSHFEFGGTVSTQNLLNAKLSNVPSSAGISDQQTPTDFYYFIGSNVSSVQQVAVPEPSSMLLAGMGAAGFGLGAWRRRSRRKENRESE